MRKGIHIHQAGAPRLRAVPPTAAPAPRRADARERVRAGESNEADDYLAQLQPKGSRSMRSRLDRVASYLSPGATSSTFRWATLRYESLLYVRTRLIMAGASASTVNLVLVACRQVARISVARGEMPPEEEARLSLVKRVQASRLPRGRMLSAEERDLLFESCAREGGALARRDACVLALGLGAGLRREEIASVSSSAVDQRALVLRFIGKGDREACVPLKAELRRAVGDWLRLRGHAPGPLIAPVTPAGVVLAGESLSDQAVYRTVLRRARLAGIPHCTPHDLRYTFISELLSTTDSETAQRLARHANFATTCGYSRRGERPQREAVERVYVPYQRPPTHTRARYRRRKKRKGVRRTEAGLQSLPKARLLTLCAAHQVEHTPEMTRAELAAAIRAKTGSE